MYQRFAQILTSFFLRKTSGQVSKYVKRITENEEEQKQIFYYGAGLLISTMIAMLISFFIAGLFHRVVEVFLFYIFFIPLRSVSGGYHAGTYLTCNLSFLICFLVGNILIYYNQDIFCREVAMVAAFIVFVTAPVEDKNKPLTDRKKRKMRVISRCIVAFELVLLFSVEFSSLHLSYIVWAMVFVAVLLLSGKIKNFKKGCEVKMSIKSKLLKWSKKFSNGALTLLAFIAVTSASQASWWLVHQPVEPECLRGAGE